MPDNLEQYYKYLKSEGADVPQDVNSFRKTLSDSATSKKYYDYLKKEGFDAPDTYDSFTITLGVKKNFGGQGSNAGGQPSSSGSQLSQVFQTPKPDKPLIYEPKGTLDRIKSQNIKDRFKVDTKLPETKLGFNTGKVGKTELSVPLQNKVFRDFNAATPEQEFGIETFRQNPDLTKNLTQPNGFQGDIQREVSGTPTALERQMSDRLKEATGAYRASQGEELTEEILSATQPKEPVVEPETDGEFVTSVKNSFSNLKNSLKGVIPRTALTSNAIVEKIIGREATMGFHNFMGYNPFSDKPIGGTYEETESRIIENLDYLESQTRSTEGIIENARNFNIPGLAAGVFDSVTSLAATAIPAVLSGGTALATDMVGRSLYDYNSTKAKSKGMTTDELYKKGQADFAVPAFIGAISFVTEKVGLKGMQTALNRQLAGKGYKGALLLAMDLNKEGGTEWIQTGLDEANVAIANGFSPEQAAEAAANAMFSEKGLEAYAKGLVGSGVMAGAGRLGKKFLTPKNKAEATKLEEQKNKAWQDLANPNVPQEAKAAIVTVLEDTAEKIDDLSVKESNEVEALVPEQRVKVDEINTNLDKVETAIADPNISESTKVVLKEQKKGLEKEIDDVLKAKPVEEVKAEPVAETTPPLVEETKTDVGSEISPDVSKDEMQGIGDGSLENVISPEPNQPFEGFEGRMKIRAEAKKNLKTDDLFEALPENAKKSLQRKSDYFYKGETMQSAIEQSATNPDMWAETDTKTILPQDGRIFNSTKQAKYYLATADGSRTRKREITKEAYDYFNQIKERYNGLIESATTRKNGVVENQPSSNEQAPTPTEATEQVLSEQGETQAEVKEVVADKAVELQSKPNATDKVLKAQKKDMLTQLNEVKDIVFGKRTEPDLIPETIAKVRDLGYEINDDGQVTFEVKGDGTFKIHADNLIDAISEVKKGFPETTDTENKVKTSSSGRVSFEQRARNRRTLEANETNLNNAKENLQTAIKSGNKKLQTVFEKEVEREQKIYDEAKRIGLPEKSTPKETKASEDQRPDPVGASVEGKGEEVKSKEPIFERPLNKKGEPSDFAPNERMIFGQGNDSDQAIIGLSPELRKEYSLNKAGEFADAVKKIARTAREQTESVVQRQKGFGLKDEGSKFIDLRHLTQQQIIDYAGTIDENQVKNNKFGGLRAKGEIATGSYGRDKKVFDGMVINQNSQGITIVTDDGVTKTSKNFVTYKPETVQSKPDSSVADSGTANVKSEEPSVSKTKLQTAKEKLKEAKAKLDRVNAGLGIASDPKEKAKAFYDYHVALVEVAKEYISEGITTVQEFAKEIGEKISKGVQDAWDEANGGKKKTVEDFEEVSSPNEPTDAELEMLGITKKEAYRIREEQGEDQYEYDVKSRTVLVAEADRMLAEGYNVPKLIKRITNGGLASDVEVEMLRRYFASLTAAINKKPTPELLAERKSLLEALDHLKTRAGRAVQAFDGFIEVEDNLASFLQDESQYYDLSPEEVQELTEKYNKAQAALEKLQKKQQEALSKARNTKAQQKINEIKARRRASVREDFAQERKAIVDDFRAKLKQIRNTPNMVMLPYQNELIALAPFVKKLTESYVKQGIFELSEIVKGIHDEFRGDMPYLTEGDVRDLIAGEYTNPRDTKNAKLARIRDLETQARLERKIEELEAGIISTKSKSDARKKSDRILELERQIKEIKKRNPELTYPSRVQARKTWYANQISNLKNEIKEGKYDPIEPPTPVLLDAEALRLKDEYIAFKEQTRLRRAKKEHEALGTVQKNIRRVQQVLALRRLIQTSIDLSIPLRQGVSVMLNPRTANIGVKGYGKMLNQVFNEKEYQRMMFDIRSSDAFLESKDDGIVYTETSSSDPETRDESHPTESFLYKIPYIREPFRASERAAAAWTNYARYELYQRGVKMLKAQGKTRENAKKAYEDMAARVMVDTGRGKIPGIEDKSPSKTDTGIKWLLGNTFYGARLMSSTFRKLNPLYYFNLQQYFGYQKVDRSVRIEALKDMAGYVSSQLILATTIAAVTGASVSLDWDDPDFLKLRWGKRVIDLTAGQSTYIRTFMRLVNATYNRANPYVSREDAEKYSKFATGSIGTFFRNKLAPNTSYGLNALMGKNSIGEKFDPWEIIKIYPMYGDDVIQAFKEGSPLDAAIILPIGISGLGYQEYSKDIRRARLSTYIDSKDVKLRSFLKNHQLTITGDINQEVYDLKAGMKVKMTKEQSDKYEKIWAEYVIAEIKDNMSELEKLAAIDKKHEEEKGYEEKLDAKISSIKSKATKVAKEKISGIAEGMMTIKSDDKTYTLTPDQIRERQKIADRFIKTEGRDILSNEKRNARMEGKSKEQAERIAQEELMKAAREESRDRIIEKYTDARGNITLQVKE